MPKTKQPYGGLFSKEPYRQKALFQKRPTFDGGSLVELAGANIIHASYMSLRGARSLMSLEAL